MVTQLGVFVLPAVPLLVLIGFLLLGRFPGEDAIERLSLRIAARRRRPRRSERVALLPARPVSWAPGGGLLIGCGLARRPPPFLL